MIPTPLCRAVMCVLYRRHLKTLHKYYQCCLWKTWQIQWEDRCTNISVLQQANTTSIEAMIIRQTSLGQPHHPDGRLHSAKTNFNFPSLVKVNNQEEGRESASRMSSKPTGRNVTSTLICGRLLPRTTSNGGRVWYKDLSTSKLCKTNGDRKRLSQKQHTMNRTKTQYHPYNSETRAKIVTVCRSWISLINHLWTHR